MTRAPELDPGRRVRQALIGAASAGNAWVIADALAA